MNHICQRIIKDVGELTLHPSDYLRDYISSVEIKCQAIDFRGVPDEVCALPLILNAAPIVWRIGGEWQEKFLCMPLASSLDYARRAMGKLYPAYDFNGRIAGNASLAPTKQFKNDALLFSGGVDSTFSFYELQKEVSVLLTIHGDPAKMSEDAPQWEHIASSASALTSNFGVEHLRIVSNFTENLSPEVLKLFPDLHAGYWSAIQHGLGFAGVAAPIMYAKKVGKLVVGASYTVGSGRSWGSHPFLEGVLDWGAGSVLHHGYTHNRIEKIERISEHSRTSEARPRLICCSKVNRSTNNCLNCSKCFRTLANCLLCEVNPADLGLVLNSNEAFDLLKTKVPKHLSKTDNEIHFWRDIKAEAIARKPKHGMPDFVRWLEIAHIRKPFRSQFAAWIRSIIPHTTRQQINSFLNRH